MADRIVPSDVAIVGNSAAARALASDLASRGVAATVFPSPAAAGSEHRVIVSFDRLAADTRQGLRSDNWFFAGAAARPDLADPDVAEALARDDAGNLGWKLALVLRGAAPAVLLDSYESERGAASSGAPIDYAASPLTSQFGIDKKFRAGPPPPPRQPTAYPSAAAVCAEVRHNRC